MSTRRGATSKKGPPKHQNTTAFKNDLHHKEPILKTLNNLQVRNVCAQCKKKLEWRIKFRKFKPRSSPGTCTKCSQKCVMHAYHIMCVPCAKKENVCPKCNVSREIVEVGPTPEEQMKLDVEMEATLRSLPERKRRSFLRYMEKNSPEYIKRREMRAKKMDLSSGKSSSNQKTGFPMAPAPCEEEEEQEKTERKYLTKSDLLAKLQALKLSVKEEDYEDEENLSEEDFSDEDSQQSSDEG